MSLQPVLGTLGRYIATLGEGLADDAAGHGKVVGLYRVHIAHAAALLPLLTGQADNAALRNWVAAGDQAYGRSYLPGAQGETAEGRFRELVEHLWRDFSAH